MGNEKSRTDNALLSIVTALIGQGLSLIIAFAARLIFVKCLSQEYLGLSGVFSNILSMLSLVELGVGPAMTFALYEPLSTKDYKDVKALMKMYKKLYAIIGALILGLGIIFLPVYPFFITTDAYIPNLNLIYILYLVNTVISYFFSYSRSLLEADQKKYYVNIIHYSFYIATNITQCLILLLFKNYILFLVIQIIFTFLSNLAIYMLANKQYYHLTQAPNIKIDSGKRKSIWINVKAMIFHKIGSIVVQATDSLLLSKFIGLSAAAIYANYSLVISAVSTVASQVFSNLTASVGNLSCSRDSERINVVFKRIWFLNSWLYGFAAIGFVSVFQVFIVVFFGENYLFDYLTVLMLSLSFYTSGMRHTVNIFKDANGLYYKDWYKPIIESIVNLVTSITLLKSYGAAGIFMGTVISNVLVSTWIEGMVVCEMVLKKKLSWYLMLYGKGFLLTLGISFVNLLICFVIPDTGLVNMLLKILISIIVPNILYLLSFHRKSEYIFYKNLVTEKVLSRMSKRNNEKR